MWKNYLTLKSEVDGYAVADSICKGGHVTVSPMFVTHQHVFQIIAGVMIVVLGILIYFFHDKLHWIGRLPGDIRIEKENFKFYFPITTLIIFSVLITIIIQIIRKVF